MWAQKELVKPRGRHSKVHSLLKIMCTTFKFDRKLAKRSESKFQGEIQVGIESA